MSSTVCRMLSFSVLCVPRQVTEEAWRVRRNVSDPTKRDSAKQNGAVNRRLSVPRTLGRTYRRTNVLDCESKVVYSFALKEARLPRRHSQKSRTMRRLCTNFRQPEVHVVQVESIPGSDSATW